MLKYKGSPIDIQSSKFKTYLVGLLAHAVLFIINTPNKLRTVTELMLI